MAQYFSISAFLYGLPVGFAFSFALGPIFFSLIKTSLEYGFRAAVSIALGVIVADLILLGIAYGGVETFLPKNNVDVTFWVQLLGGLLLLGLGMSTMLKKGVYTEGSPLMHERRFFKHFSLGFFINIVNPANFFEWMGAASVLKTKYQFETFENISFFVGALLAVFLTELMVAYFAMRLRKILNNRVIYWINLVTGGVFLGFGLWLLWSAFKSY
jgi:threonine/homoserine/homoserine lactone efflux protein